MAKELSHGAWGKVELAHGRLFCYIGGRSSELMIAGWSTEEEL